MPDNIVDKFKGIRQWVHIYKQKETYLYLLETTNLIADQRKKVDVLRGRISLLQQELADEETRLQNQIEAIPANRKWLDEHRAEYEVKEQFASDAIQKLAEKVQTERDRGSD